MKLPEHTCDYEVGDYGCVACENEGRLAERARIKKLINEIATERCGVKDIDYYELLKAIDTEETA